jgi:hypothetical protein
MIERNIGAYIKASKGINPANTSAGTVNGAAIDRAGIGGGTLFHSCVLHGACGAATGSPSAQTVDNKLQDSADGSTGWADITGASTGWADITGAALTQLTADNGEAEKDVDLSSAKRYIRVVNTVDFTGGTSPAIPVAAEVVLGGSEQLPV